MLIPRLRIRFRIRWIRNILTKSGFGFVKNADSRTRLHWQNINPTGFYVATNFWVEFEYNDRNCKLGVFLKCFSHHRKHDFSQTLNSTLGHGVNLYKYLNIL